MLLGNGSKLASTQEGPNETWEERWLHIRGRDLHACCCGVRVLQLSSAPLPHANNAEFVRARLGWILA